MGGSAVRQCGSGLLGGGSRRRSAPQVWPACSRFGHGDGDRPGTAIRGLRTDIDQGSSGSLLVVRVAAGGVLGESAPVAWRPRTSPVSRSRQLVAATALPPPARLVGAVAAPLSLRLVCDSEAELNPHATDLAFRRSRLIICCIYVGQKVDAVSEGDSNTNPSHPCARQGFMRPRFQWCGRPTSASSRQSAASGGWRTCAGEIVALDLLGPSLHVTRSSPSQDPGDLRGRG
jgi:hypothetical protein